MLKIPGYIIFSVKHFLGCLPWWRPVVFGAVQQRTDIGLVSPSHINHKYACRKEISERKVLSEYLKLQNILYKSLEVVKFGNNPLISVCHCTEYVTRNPLCPSPIVLVTGGCKGEGHVLCLFEKINHAWIQLIFFTIHHHSFVLPSLIITLLSP